MTVKVGFVIIATNKYIKFVGKLLESIDSYCFKNDDFLVFKYILTNKKITFNSKNSQVFRIKHQPWPFITLKRFELINKISDSFRDLDYIFYIDADSRIVSPIGNDILSLFSATIHPYAFKQQRSKHAYENNKISTAYIPPEKGENYYYGGFYGGEIKSFLKMAKTLQDNITIDLNNGIIAVYHDESHLNKYLVENPPSLQLHPGYSYPEEAILPFEKKILALAKDHKEIRKESIVFRIYSFIRERLGFV